MTQHDAPGPAAPDGSGGGAFPDGSAAGLEERVRGMVGELVDKLDAWASHPAVVVHAAQAEALLSRHGALLAASACLVLAVPPLLARRWLLAAACATCAAACAAWVEGLPLLAPALVAVSAMMAWDAMRSRRRSRRRVSRRRDAEERIARLDEQLAAERFWRIASGDDRQSLADPEVLDLARRVQQSLEEEIVVPGAPGGRAPGRQGGQADARPGAPVAPISAAPSSVS